MTPLKYLTIFFLACLLVPVVVSADRLLIYSEGGSDGRAGRASVNENWTTIIMGAGNTASTSASVVNQIQNSGTRPNFQNNYRPIIMWNTSSIPDDATITAAKIGLYRASAGSAALGSTCYGIVGCIPASNITIANADYQSFVKTPRYASDIASESIVTGGYTNWSFNPAGIANVSKTAYTRIMFVQAFDIDGTNPGYVGSIYVSSLTVYGGEDSTRKPFIEITYTPAEVVDATPPGFITNLTNTTICDAINWSWGNPVDADFHQTVIYKDSTFLKNVSGTTTHDRWDGLTSATNYTFSTKTCDITGHCNATWVNQSARTANTCILIIYSESGSDGRAGRASVNENWTTIIAGAGNTASTSASVVNQIQNSGTRPNFQNNYRPIIMWNTSSIPDVATITAAKIGLYRASAGSAALGSTSYGIVGCTPASNTTIATTDYQSLVKTPRYASDIACESIVTGGYTNWSLNPAGITNVSKTAYTRIMFVQAFDIDGTNPGYVGSTYVSSLTVYGGEDFTRKPFIEISYTTGTINPVASFKQNESLGYITLPVSFTDTSTYAPSTWYWSFGDGNTSTSQNPNHNYGYCGNFTVSLKVSNVAGSDWENKTNAVKVLCNSPPPTMKKLNHNATYLKISTYDGTYQLTHPSVIYTSTGWNGYNYLMAMTPYPAGVEDHENPSMRYSNDMFTWEKISGQPDPIISAPVSGHYSDPNIVLNGSTLYMFYKYNNGTSVDYINYSTTTDGILWTSSVKTNLASLLSPSFVYNGTGWEAWGNPLAGSHQLEHYTTSDLTTWTKSGTVSGINIGSSTQWHSEVKYYDSQYQMLLVPISYDRLFYFNSTNGLTWVGSENNPVLVGRSSGYWDEKLYKSSFIERSNEFDVFYTGWTSSNVWHVGYSKFPSGP